MKQIYLDSGLPEKVYFKILQRHLREASKKITDTVIKEGCYKGSLKITGKIPKPCGVKSGRRAFCLFVQTDNSVLLISIKKDGYREMRLPKIQNGKIISKGKKIPDADIRKYTLLSFLLKEAVNNSCYFLQSEQKFYHIVSDVIKTPYGIVYSTSGCVTSFVGG